MQFRFHPRTFLLELNMEMPSLDQEKRKPTTSRLGAPTLVLLWSMDLVAGAGRLRQQHPQGCACPALLSLAEQNMPNKKRKHRAPNSREGTKGP